MECETGRNDCFEEQKRVDRLDLPKQVCYIRFLKEKGYTEEVHQR